MTKGVGVQVDQQLVTKAFESLRHENRKSTDRMFCYLFLFQWFLGVLFALLISPRTWEGDYSQTHIHVYAAVLLGALLTAYPSYLCFKNPGRTGNGYFVSVAQAMFSVLYIHLTGGRIETHFHIFGSLALLAFYFDCRLLVIATTIAVLDHFVRGAFWPRSVYGVLSATPWRAIEHGGWILFEDLFLFMSIQRGLKTLESIAKRQVSLENALALAQHSNQVQSNFLSNMSHELRTPLHAMMGFARLGQNKIRSISDEKVAFYFDQIYKSGIRLLKLVNDLLDLARMEASEVEYHMKDYDLIEILGELELEMQALFEDKGLRLEIQASQQKVVGFFDPERLKQVLANILSNSIRYSENGTIVRALVRQYPDSLRCEVYNRGVGVPESELSTIFDKFIQSSKTKTNSGGTGLGLSICREIINKHGGRIWMENMQNGETCLIFELPRIQYTTLPEESEGTK